MHPRPIRFVHQGLPVAVGPDVAPTRTLLEWLREDAGCMAAKEGCAEGDCGACTVVLARPDDDGGDGGGVVLEPVNACIRLLPSVDGHAVYTAEDLPALAAPAALHPVQQAMVDAHASQCGFCTPGFVMTLWERYEHHLRDGSRPTRQQVADALAGNLCRCTGYRPIVDAALAMFDGPPAPLDRPALARALATLDTHDPLHWPGRCFVPRTLGELAAHRAAQPDALLVAGATDVGLWVTKQLQTLPELIFVGAVADLRRIEERDGTLVIGAGASLESAWAALARHWPALQELWLRFAGPPIRRTGTMGGNVANGSPIGDAAPALMALGAALELRRGDSVRTLALDEFYVDYRVNRLQPGEFVQAVRVPLPAGAQLVRAYKLAKRFDSDISAVCGAFALEIDGGVVRDVRLAFGGMAATVRRAAGAEAALRGRRWDETALDAAQRALAADFSPLSDLRASAGYRQRAAANLLRRFWLETRAASPVAPQALRVWPLGPAREASA